MLLNKTVYKYLAVISFCLAYVALLRPGWAHVLLLMQATWFALNGMDD